MNKVNILTKEVVATRMRTTRMTQPATHAAIVFRTRSSKFDFFESIENRDERILLESLKSFELIALIEVGT